MVRVIHADISSYTVMYSVVMQSSVYVLSMFGSSLTELMTLQQDHFPDRRLPWIQTMLSEEILRLNGVVTEGIFRFVFLCVCFLYFNSYIYKVLQKEVSSEVVCHFITRKPS